MMLVLIVLLVLIYIWYQRSPTQMSDTMTIQGVMKQMAEERPELVPIETVYIDPNGNSRFLFYNTENYSGEIKDFNAKVGVSRNIQSFNDDQKLSEYSKA